MLIRNFVEFLAEYHIRIVCNHKPTLFKVLSRTMQSHMAAVMLSQYGRKQTAQTRGCDNC